MPDENDTSHEVRRNGLAVALSIGWELVAFTGLSFWLGYWLDGRFRTSPWGVLVCTFIGIYVALYRLIRTFSRSPYGGSGRR